MVIRHPSIKGNRVFYAFCYLLISLLGFNGKTALAANILDDDEGIGLQSTRVIYPSDALKGVTFTVTNRTANVYLLQSRVIDWVNVFTIAENSQPIEQDSAIQASTEANGLPPYIVLPPLVRVDPQDKITLRIQLINDRLPIDRESIFTLVLKAIPSQTKGNEGADSTSAQVILALQNNLKLFYRPKSLPKMEVDLRAKALTFALQGKTLTIKNPTPYYITLSELTIDEKPVPLSKGNMLPPFATEKYNITTSVGNTISWRIIDDKGLKSREYQQLIPFI